MYKKMFMKTEYIKETNSILELTLMVLYEKEKSTYFT